MKKERRAVGIAVLQKFRNLLNFAGYEILQLAKFSQVALYAVLTAF